MELGSHLPVGFRFKASKAEGVLILILALLTLRGHAHGSPAQLMETWGCGQSLGRWAGFGVVLHGTLLSSENKHHNTLTWPRAWAHKPEVEREARHHRAHRAQPRLHGFQKQASLNPAARSRAGVVLGVGAP